MKGAVRRLEREQSDRGWLAWHIGALSRTDKFPPLSDFTSPVKKAAQDPVAKERALDALFLAWGGDPEQLRAAHAKRGKI